MKKTTSDINKKLLPSTKASQKRVSLFYQKLIFNKKYRNDLKKDLIKTLNSGKKYLDMSSPYIKDPKISKNRDLAKAANRLSKIILKPIKYAEGQDKYNDQKGSFILFKNKNTYVFSEKTLRDKKIRKANLIFANGLPKKTAKKAILHRWAVAPSNFIKIDSGKYHFKTTSFECGQFLFWGKLDKYFIDFNKAKVINKSETKLELRCKLTKD